MKKFRFNRLMSLPVMVLSAGLIMTSCKKDDPEPTPTPEPTPEPTAQSSTYSYEFNNGQVVPTAAYDGMLDGYYDGRRIIEYRN